MNAERRITLGQLEHAEPCKPACNAGDFAADKLRVLEALEQAGAAGLTTRELMDRGGGMRPPNRIHDLREDGVAIKTVSEGRGIYRYILCKYLPEEKTNACAKPLSDSQDWYERQTGKPRPGWQSRPFSEKRMAQDDCFVLTPPEPRQ